MTNMRDQKNTSLLITCGPGLRASATGDMIVLDWNAKKIIDHARFTHDVYPDSHKGLAGASWNDKGVLVAAECELLEFSVCPLQLVQRRTFPFLNDVHHLVASNGSIWVCNTGMDCVDELDDRWEFRKTHDLLGPLTRRLRYAKTSIYFTALRQYEWLRGWRQPYRHLPNSPLFRNTKKLLWPGIFRRNNTRDLRRSLFRPHVLHPNHLLALPDDVWVTINTTGEIVSLSDRRIVANNLGRAHDGIVVDQEHYVTDAKGNRVIVHRFEPEGPTLTQRIHDRCIMTSPEDGFLRGIAVVGDLVFVGVTVRRGPGAESRFARIVALRRDNLDRCGEWEIPHEYGRQVFSVLDATQKYAQEK